MDNWKRKLRIGAKKQKKTMINILVKGAKRCLQLLLLLTIIPYCSIGIACNNPTQNNLDLKCIESKVEKELIIKYNLDAQYYYTIKINNVKDIILVKPFSALDDNYLFIFNQIKNIIVSNYKSCIYKENILLQLKVDFSEGGVKVTATN